MSNRLYEDPIVAEIHAIRAEMLRDCDGDHEKLMQKVRERQESSDRMIVSARVKVRSTATDNET